MIGADAPCARKRVPSQIEKTVFVLPVSMQSMGLSAEMDICGRDDLSPLRSSDQGAAFIDAFEPPLHLGRRFGR